MRVWLQEATGLPGTATERGGRYARRRIGGYSHLFHDVTEQPSPSITAGSVLNVAVTEGGVEPLPDPRKPPYQIPSMADIDALRGSNGYRMASTFSGCGGSCLGFEWAGFDVAWASEFIPAAQDVYRLNHPHTILDTRDIREVTSKEVLRTLGLSSGDLDVFEGSPPCSAFSMAGKRSKGWGQEKKYSDSSQSNVEDLFYEWVRLLDGIKPRTFVAENVAGLNRGVAKGYLIDIVKRMKACGYRVKVGDLDAQWLGVPQRRRRLIFVGVRDDLGVEPRFPTPLPYRYSVADACPWIVGYKYDDGGRLREYAARTFSEDTPAPTITVGAGSTNANHHKVVAPPVEPTLPDQRPSAARRVYSKRQTGFDAEGMARVPGHTHGFEDVTDVPHPTIDTSTNAIAIVDTPPVEAAADITRFAIGKDARDIPEGGSSEKYINSVRAHRGRPSPTVTAAGGGSSTASVLHPTELRKFSIAELRRICGFPDDFQLTGSYAQQWERLGRAVPPPMMRAVAETVAGILREVDG